MLSLPTNPIAIALPNNDDCFFQYLSQPMFKILFFEFCDVMKLATINKKKKFR
jgi:hypothetical protein